MMESDVIAKLRWSCRRGMKELDLMLIAFSENKLTGLSEAQLQAFQSLLQLDDITLFDSLFKHQRVAEPAIQTMIEMIRHYHQNNQSCGRLS